MKREDTRGGLQSTTRVSNSTRASVRLCSCKTLALLFGKKSRIVERFWVYFHLTYASAKARKLDHRLPIRGSGAISSGRLVVLGDIGSREVAFR